MARKKPLADNAIRRIKVVHPVGLPIFFAKGNHRPDNVPSITLMTDNNMGLKTWPGGVSTASTHVIGDD